MKTDPAVADRLSCAEAEPLLPLVADGALDAAGDPELFFHLADCPHCQQLLASHDLLTLALERTPPPPVPKIIRWRFPLGIAAGLMAIVGFGWLMHPAPAEAARRTVAVAPPAKPAPVPADPDVDAHPEIEVDVAAVPSPIPGRTMYLVRRGEQVLLVDPVAGTSQPAHTDAKPATYHRY